PLTGSWSVAPTRRSRILSRAPRPLRGAGIRLRAAQLPCRLRQILRRVDGPPVRAVRQREAGQAAFAGQAGEGRALVVAALRQQLPEAGREDIDAGVDQIRR